MNEAKQATQEELCASALAHYEEVSTKCCHWSSSVPRAIKYYFLERPKLEAELVRFRAPRAALLQPIKGTGYGST